jgi:Protein of unknown function (DUF2442)
MDKQNSTLDAELLAQIDHARQVGAELDATEPRAVKAWYDERGDRVFTELRSGVVMGFPRTLLQGLREATLEQLMEVEITPSGYGLHWESLDVDLSVPQLVAGVYGTQKWMSDLGLYSQVR